MNRFSIPIAVSAAVLVATTVSADQYVAKIDATFQGASASLLEALKVVEIEIFDHEGAKYIVVEAPDEGYVKAYFFAVHRVPEELYLLQADWMASGLSGLSLEQRLPFLTQVTCDFCTS